MADLNPASASPVSTTDRRDSSTTTRNPAWLIPAILVLGLALPYVGERLVDTYDRLYYPPDHGQVVPPPEYVEAEHKAMTINSAVGYGAFGAVFFLCLGGVLGGSYSIANAFKGAVLGLILGGALAAGTAAVGTKIEQGIRQGDLDGMTKTALILGGEFLVFGIVAALLTKLAGSSAELARGVGLAVGVSLIALIVHIIGSAIAFPFGWSDGLHPDNLGIRYIEFYTLGLAAVGTAIVMLRGQKSP